MIKLTGITKYFGDLVAVDNLSLELEKGDMFGFIGPNGAGKSTTMKVLACLLQADEGSASVCGMDCATHGPQIRCRLGYMPDYLGVYDDLKVYEYLDFFAAAFSLPRKKRKRIVGDVLDLTDLVGKRDALVDSLSRGMQQRLGVARVLIHDPEVLLLDEPASGLDPRARIEIRSLLMELRRMGKTIMVSSHILSELEEMCNKIGIIERGRLVFSGTIEEANRESGLHSIIELDVDDHQRATGVLNKLDAIESVTADNGSLVVTLSTDLPSLKFIPEALIRAGVGVEQMRPRHNKLEDVFLRLTEGEVS